MRHNHEDFSSDFPWLNVHGIFIKSVFEMCRPNGLYARVLAQMCVYI